MRILSYILMIFILSCNNQPKQISLKPENGNKKLNMAKDTILIILPEDTIKYPKDEYDKIVDNNPEFFNEYPQDPDLLYAHKKNKGEFQSEVGQDSFFILYQHFLKPKNGINEYEQERENLIEIYSIINSIFQKLENGGTYFGHQYWRIFGYAEYSVYLYKTYEPDIDKSYSIKGQKDLYIKSLYQLVDDKIKNDSDITDEHKALKTKDIYKLINTLGAKITNIFYLRRAQEFQYKHYEYYS